MAKINNTTVVAALTLGALGLLAMVGGAEATPEPVPRRPKEPQREPSESPDPTEQAARSKKIQPGGSSAVSQPEIINAVWALLADRNEAPLRGIVSELSQMPPELQCYLKAALSVAQQEYKIWMQSIQDYRDVARRIANDAKNREKETNAAFSTVIAAVNVIPGVGQAISAILALGYALGKLLGESAVDGRNAIEIWNNRLKDLSFLKDWEGSDSWRGLKLNRRYPTEGQLRRYVDGDLIASRLPNVAFATKYFFTPTLESYQAVAKSAKLYSNEYIIAAYGFNDAWTVNGDQEYPTTAWDIRKYANGYSAGAAQTPYEDRNHWFTIGYEDGHNGRPSRVGLDLQLWANNVIEGE